MAIHPSATIASTARVAAGAAVAEDVEIGEFVIVEDDVVIGPRTKLEPHVVVKRWTTLGADNQISVGTVLGTDPLDKNFSVERSYLTIGNRNRIREHYTISRGTQPESVTVIGDDNYIMTSGHIAHNCRLGSNIVVCSCALIAGYVEIEDNAFVSGGVVVHQFSKIGRLAMIGGNTRVNKDAAPYFLYSEFNITPRGLNLVGLRRAGFSAADIAALKKAYRLLFREGLTLEDALERIEEETATEHTRHLVEFVRGSKRGIARR
jgi:UDP-N-acetylglucosamine acyltransferase